MQSEPLTFPTRVTRGSSCTVVPCSLHPRTARKLVALTDRRPMSKVKSEVALLRLCKHPHVVSMCKAYKVDEFSCCIEMEWLECTLSRSRLKGSQATLLQWLEQTCLGLRHIHSKGVVHRDIKLDNLMLGCRGNVKIIDFGISVLKAKIDPDNLSVSGSPAYMAPQLFQQRPYDEKVDVYALGVCLYELIHGYLPYSGKCKHDYWRDTVRSGLVCHKKCPRQWVWLLQRMLSKEKEERISVDNILMVLQHRAFDVIREGEFANSS